MKVLLINGSPHKEGCTYTALTEVAGALEQNHIQTELYHIGTGPVRGCIACGKCYDGSGKCVFGDDPCNEIIEKMNAVDGIVVGSPVHYASACGALCALLDRAFYAGPSQAGKPAAAVVSCRRGGASAAFDRLNKYFTISRMPVVSSQYWNSIHGHTAEEAKQDLEGLQIMRTLGRNMAWMLHTAQAANLPFPEPEPERQITNYIR